jgi:bifunctional non-homologous end joining protein LigD
MPTRPVARSKRQYVQGLNIPALRLVRDLPGVKGAPMPAYIEPCLATLATRPPAAERYVHEIKFDGYRLQLHIANGQVRCFTRRGHDWADRFPTIVNAASRLNLDAAIIDGEAVVLTEKGDTDFAALESYVSSKQPERSSHNVVFYAFDLLYLRSLDLRGAPLIGRKRALRELLASEKENSPLRYSQHLEVDGEAMWRNACGMELEGIVSKRKDSSYHSGRSREWIKATCRHRDTFFVMGIAQKGKKFDGVYLAQRRNGKVVYAGKVKHGFTDEQVRYLRARAARHTTSRQPIAARRAFPKAQWLHPKLQAEVEYRRKTRSGLLRHPSYKGLREDLD